ncbi:type ISP restriction/modification enzyme [Streptomyces sp. NPDC055287]
MIARTPATRSDARGALEGPDDPDALDAPLLGDLMPWSVAPLRLGRDWVLAPDSRTLRARWDTFVRAEGAGREELFGATRARTTRTSVAALPGQRTGTGRLARESGPCPDPVRVLHGPFDEQWLIPDHRLIDAARPELWRVTDDSDQLFALEQGYVPGPAAGPALLVGALLPDGRSPTGRPGRIRPLYRRPGGREPNLAPGLLPLLSGRYRHEVTAGDVLAWAVTAAQGSPAGAVVPLPAEADVWAAGVELGRRTTAVQVRGARAGQRPRLPGGRRPYVRSAVPAWPSALRYDAQEEVLHLGEGRVSPVPAAAWDFHTGGVRVLETWFERRTAPAEPGSLEAIRPAAWPKEWTSDLLELITVLALLAELDAGREALRGGERITRGELAQAGVLPVPEAARRPASVLDHQEEGPEGQFALL